MEGGSRREGEREKLLKILFRLRHLTSMSGLGQYTVQSAHLRRGCIPSHCFCNTDHMKVT